MQVKHFIGVFALLFAGLASAQTVPAEAWVGASFATATTAISRSAVTTDLQRSIAAAHAPSEQWVGTGATATIAVGALSRAEVLADQNLWNRAGLDAYARGEGLNAAGSDYARRLAAYQQARRGSAYLTEVQRIKGARSNALVGAKPAGTSATQ